MPILTQDTAYPISREIIYLKENEGSFAGLVPRSIRPASLDTVLCAASASGLRAVQMGLQLIDRRLHPAIGITFWGSDTHGDPVRITADEADPEILRAGFALLSDVNTPDPLDIAAEAADEDNRYWRATYLPHCTVIGWDHPGHGLEEHIGTDPELDEWSPSFSEILGTVYALSPTSNHEHLALKGGIRQDLAFHSRLVKIETGFLFTLKE